VQTLRGVGPRLRVDLDRGSEPSTPPYYEEPSDQQRQGEHDVGRAGRLARHESGNPPKVSQRGQNASIEPATAPTPVASAAHDMIRISAMVARSPSTN
jgi:hypothetical protein